MSLDRKQALSILEEAMSLMSKVVEDDDADQRGHWLIEPMPPEQRREQVSMVMRRLRACLTMLEADEELDSVRKPTRKKAKKT